MAPRHLAISGGSRRGLKIRVPAGIRPSSGRLREALFDIWAGRLAGSRFLDLFAGSGAVGIEAVSRGAGLAVLVEGNREVHRLLEDNLRRSGLVGLEARRARLPGGLARCLGAGERRFDLVFADPPYGFDRFTSLLAEVERWLADGGEIALEHGWREGPPSPPEGLTAPRSRRYGDSGLSLFRRATVRSARGVPPPNHPAG